MLSLRYNILIDVDGKYKGAVLHEKVEKSIIFSSCYSMFFCDFMPGSAGKEIQSYVFAQ
jgi:hypothetical protein